MHKLKQYWQSLLASINKSVKTPARTAAVTAAPKQETSAVRRENQLLAAKLEMALQEMADTRNTDKNKLAELEQANHALETARLDEINRRVELESRLDEIESERKQTREQLGGLEASLATASTQLEKTGAQIKQLEFEALLHEERLLEMQTKVRTQDQRLSWTRMVAGFAVVLAAVSGVILILEGHRDAALLTGMKNDIQQLLTAMDQHLGTRHQARTAPVTTAVTATARTAGPDDTPAIPRPVVLPEEAAAAADKAPPAAGLPDSEAAVFNNRQGDNRK